MTKLLKALKALLYAVFGSWGALSQHADHLSARYHDNKSALLMQMVLALLQIVVSALVIVAILLAFFLRQDPELALWVWLLLMSNLLITVWMVHFLRHASWRFTQLFP